MPTFDTPAPISLDVELGVGDVLIVAEERTETTVEVRPTDAGRKADVTAAQQARVEFKDGRLTIKAARGWRQWTPRGGPESIDVEVRLPAGSGVQVQAGVATLRCSGRLGQGDLRTGVGEIRVAHAGPLKVRTGAGDITVEHVAAHAEISTGSGAVHLGRVDASAAIKNANGDTWVGEVTGELTVQAANGAIAVDHAEAGVAARTANGNIRIGDVARGAVLAQTSNGRVEIAIQPGIAAWLDVNTHFGRVDNQLAASDRPAPGQPTVEVRARSAFGDITVRRSPVAAPDAAAAAPAPA